MNSPYELLAGLALLREKKRLADNSGRGSIESWSALLVRVGDDICVLRQDDVEEIITQERLTRVNDVEPWILGLSYFHGKLINVMDGRLLFSRSASARVNESVARILVVQGDSEWFGLKVDELVGIRHVWSDSLDTSPHSAGDDWLGLAEHWVSIENDRMPVLQIRSLIQRLENSGSLIAQAKISEKSYQKN